MDTYCKPDSIIPQNDTDRLNRLYKYDILDTPIEETFDNIASLAAQIFDTPGAFITFVDTGRVFFKSNIGNGELREVLREDSLCSLAILNEETTVFNDTHQVPDLVENVYVKCDGGIRFYAGAPLKTLDGYNMGTVCVVDTVPRQVTQKQIEMLETLSAIIIDKLELRLTTRNVVRVQTELMNMTVHDLRNPLTAISLYAKLINQRSAEPNTKMMAAKINTATARILNDLNNLLELSKIEDGFLTLNYEQVDIIALLKKVIGNLQILANQKHQIINLYNDCAVSLKVDGGRMQEVFENLLSNAIKYSHHNSIIDISVYDEGENFVFEFRDQGLGLNETDMSKLFIKFARLSAVPTNKEPTNGLGLSIVKILVELHSGTIWATSAGKNKGSSFFVSLAKPKVIVTAAL